MADEKTPETPSEGANSGEQQRQFALRNVYIKDLSFEGPNTPEIFRREWKPETNLQLDIKLQQLADDAHEVTLTVTATTKVEEMTAYIVEIQQAGIITVANIPDQELAPLFYIYCPGLLFPYARQAVSDMVTKGGFPNLMLQHVNFDAIYAQKMAEQQAAAAEKPEGETAH